MNTRLSTLSMALAMAFAAPSALALGLGQMQVRSGLNQPLVAEIPIISATPAEVNELDVHLAPPDAFAAVGLDRPSGLSANLQFSVGKNTAGQPVIRVSTAGRFNEPILSFLIEAQWAKGAVTREYTALIDPPYIAPAVVRPMSAPAIAEAPMAPSPTASAPTPAAPTPVAEAAETPPAQTEPASEPAPAVASPMPEPSAAPAPATPEPQPVAAEPAPKPPRPAPAPAPKPIPAAKPAPSGDYGPVAEGKTLWAIASQVRPDPSVSVNQVMLALLRINPDAFADSNINQLKRGAVLRIPNRDDIATLSPDDAAALVREQAAAWKAPHSTVPQPAEGVASTAPAPVRPAASAPARPAARLEIVPPSGKPSAKGMQSGATAGGGGSELRAELLQTKEDLAARTAEVTELKSRVSDLEKQEADRQHLIDLQNSQLKDLQTRLEQQQAAPAPAPAAAAPPPPAAAAAVASAPVPAEVAQETPIYLNPWILGGGGLILVGGLVFALRRKPAAAGSDDSPSRRLSDDEALRVSLAKTRAGSIRPPVMPAREPVIPAPLAAPVIVPIPAPVVTTTPPADAELDACLKAVRNHPQDIEAHLNLLRLHHARGNAVDYEAAAQDMRDQVSSTLDPRWREAVIMGASLMPGHSLFNQAGWNAPRFETAEPAAKPLPPMAMDTLPEAPSAPVPPTWVATPVAMPEPIAASSVFDLPADEVAPLTMLTEDAHIDSMHDFGDGGLDLIDAPGELADAIPGRGDPHRTEAEVQEEDDASATRIELAKAYLDIGDLDGARSMLEEVMAEGGPAAQAEAERILREIG